MRYVLAALIVFSAQSHAGWLKNFCRDVIVADDPYQFEHYRQEWLEREAERLHIKKFWGTITEQDAIYLEIIDNELLRRKL